MCWSVDVPPPPPPPLQPHGRFNAQQIQTRAHGDGAGFAQQNASVFHRTAQHPAVSGKRGDGAGQLVQVGTHCSHGVRGREKISNQSICNLKWDKSIGQTRETKRDKERQRERDKDAQWWGIKVSQNSSKTSVNLHNCNTKAFSGASSHATSKVGWHRKMARGSLPLCGGERERNTFR